MIGYTTKISPYELHHVKTGLDKNRSVQSQKARSLKFLIYEEAGLYYLWI